MIHVQMRAHDNIDVFRPDAGRFKLCQPAPFPAVEKRPAAILVITAACIHKDDLACRPDQKTLYRDHQQLCLRTVEPRHEPRKVFSDVVRGAVRQQLER